MLSAHTPNQLREREAHTRKARLLSERQGFSPAVRRAIGKGALAPEGRLISLQRPIEAHTAEDRPPERNEVKSKDLHSSQPSTT